MDMSFNERHSFYFEDGAKIRHEFEEYALQMKGLITLLLMQT